MNTFGWLGLLLIMLLVTMACVYGDAFWEWFHVNIIVFLTIKRGILAPDCFWYAISDLYPDPTGVQLTESIKHRMNPNAPFTWLNIYGTRVCNIMDVTLIQEILDNSPTIYGVGKFKENFFRFLMPKNVGVSQGVDWQRRRHFNDQVLETDQKHHMMPVFETYIREILGKELPVDFASFGRVAKRITMKIVFGVDEVFEPLFDILQKANTMWSLTTDGVNSEEQYVEYRRYVMGHLRKPQPGCLLHWTKQQHHNLSDDELFQQVPHWVFPINGLMSVHAPRLLLLLHNHPMELRKALTEESHWRKCILELFRLNNPVNSTFRTVLQDTDKFKKGDQLLVLNNPMLRDPQGWENPHRYQPNRWNSQLEQSYYAIMFNQGPQRCPGKELALTILQSFVRTYVSIVGSNYKTQKVDVKQIPFMINPCPIAITHS